MNRVVAIRQGSEKLTFGTTRVLLQELTQVINIALNDDPDIAVSSVLGDLIS